MPTRLPEHMPIVDERIDAGGYTGRYREQELERDVDLCDARGRLNPEAVGWSRQPLVRANLARHPLRKKRWNFWNWIEPGFVLSATLADIDYASLWSAFFIDFETGDVATAGGLGRPGRVSLPEEVDRSIGLETSRFAYDHEVGPSDRRVRLRARTADGRTLEAKLRIDVPAEQESLNVVVPWSADRFQLNSKHNTLPTSGHIQVGERRYEVDPGRCHAVQDWGRGVWPRVSFWNWGVCTGVQAGRRIGVNVGARWTTGTGANENGILLDGRLHKVMEDLIWDYHPEEDASLWRVRSIHSDVIDMTLSPRFAHRSSTNAGLIRSGGVCSFGRWHGRVRVDDEVIEIDGLPGWAEEFEHRW